MRPFPLVPRGPLGPLMFQSCQARSNRSKDLAGTEIAKRSLLVRASVRRWGRACIHRICPHIRRGEVPANSIASRKKWRFDLIHSIRVLVFSIATSVPFDLFRPEFFRPVFFRPLLWHPSKSNGSSTVPCGTPWKVCRWCQIPCYC